jgi:hypothetical protein
VKRNEDLFELGSIEIIFTVGMARIQAWIIWAGEIARFALLARKLKSAFGLFGSETRAFEVFLEDA